MCNTDGCTGCEGSLGDEQRFAQCIHCQSLGTYCATCAGEAVCSSCRGRFYDPSVPFRKQLITPITICRPSPPSGTLYLSLTCDWEGRELIKQYRANMTTLRKVLQTITGTVIPITHFVTPRSYGKSIADILNTADAILPGDEVGLHIHAWNDLLTEMKDEALAEEGAKLTDKYDTGSDGKDTPLAAFQPKSIAKIVEYCHSKLEAMSGVKAKSFRGGAWFASDAIYEALAAVGVTVDSSPIPYNLINYPTDAVANFLKGLWGDDKANYGNALTAAKAAGPITIETQPYDLAVKTGSMRVMPLTWGMEVNNQTKETILGWSDAEKQRVLTGADRFVNFGFHDTLTMKGNAALFTWVPDVMAALWPALQTGKHRFVTVSDAAALVH